MVAVPFAGVLLAMCGFTWSEPAYGVPHRLLDSVLIMLDGVPVTQNVLDSLGPERIERISVLKDSAAVAAYGAKGCNGVILIFSKKIPATDTASRHGAAGETLPTMSAGPAACRALEEEAVRVVASSPVWEPGKQSNKPVRIKYVLPVNFVSPADSLAK